MIWAQRRAVCWDRPVIPADRCPLSPAGAALSRLWRVTRHCLAAWHWGSRCQGPARGHSAYLWKLPSLLWLACQSRGPQIGRTCTYSAEIENIDRWLWVQNRSKFFNIRACLRPAYNQDWILRHFWTGNLFSSLTWTIKHFIYGQIEGYSA